MLCTLVIAIGTFPYALRAVTITWPPDQDKIPVCGTLKIGRFLDPPRSGRLREHAPAMKLTGTHLSMQSNHPCLALHSRTESYSEGGVNFSGRASRFFR
jgi:hypothetical protein